MKSQSGTLGKKLKMSSISIRWRTSTNFSFKQAKEIAESRCTLFNARAIVEKIEARTISELMDRIKPNEIPQKITVELLSSCGFLANLRDRITVMSKLPFDFTHRQTETIIINSLKFSVLIEFKKKNTMPFFDQVESFFVNDHPSLVTYELSLYCFVLGPDLEDGHDPVSTVGKLGPDLEDGDNASRRRILTHTQYSSDFVLTEWCCPYECIIPQNKILYTYDDQSKKVFQSQSLIPASFGFGCLKSLNNKKRTKMVPVIEVDSFQLPPSAENVDAVDMAFSAINLDA
jgi:hypothetical protein